MRKLTTKEFIEKAKEIHGENNYDYSKVNYKDSFSKIRIICKKHGEFLQTPSNHLCGKGCPVCSGNKKLTTEEFIEKAREIHKDNYDYSKVNYKNALSKVTIICKKHGEFLQTPHDHLCRCGCLECYKDSKKLTTEEFIERAKEIHKDNYDYSKVNYKNVLSKVTIICKKHGEFLQTPKKHLNGRGCQKCGGSEKLTTEEFIERAKEIHKNNYDYSKVNYKNAHSKITIICKKHGEFLQIPNNHLNGNGCPKCNFSKLEELVNSILEKMNLSFNNYSKFEWLGKQNLDVYIESLNLGIESQGIQHFIPIEHFGGEKKFKLTQKRDKTKLHLSEKNGIDIIYFITPEMTQFSDIPENFLKPRGYMGKTIIQSEKELYNIIKNRCIEKGVNFVKISEYETVYRNPKFKII